MHLGPGVSQRPSYCLLPIRYMLTNSPPFPGKKTFRDLPFSKCWQFFSPTLGCDQGSPCSWRQPWHLLGGWGCGRALLRTGAGSAPFAAWPLGRPPGWCSSLNAGVPKWLGIWPSDKTGHFANSCLLAHHLGKKNWGFKIPFKIARQYQLYTGINIRNVSPLWRKL